MRKLRIIIEGENLRTWITSDQEYWNRSQAFRDELFKHVAEKINDLIDKEKKRNGTEREEV